MNKPTPGPHWYEASMGNGFQGLVVDERTGANVAVVYDKANAPLIAWAPEMKEALEQIVARWEHGDLAEAVRRGATILKELEA